MIPQIQEQFTFPFEQLVVIAKHLRPLGNHFGRGLNSNKIYPLRLVRSGASAYVDNSGCIRQLSVDLFGNFGGGAAGDRVIDAYLMSYIGFH